MKTPQPQAKPAFTLIETLVAISIITILAAILFPSLLNWQNNVQQDRVRATSTVLSQACVRAGLAGVTVPAGSRGTLGDLFAWYQANGYIQNAKVDITNLSLTDLGTGSFFDCTDGAAGTGGTTSDIFAGGTLVPGPVAALWWNTRYIQVGLPGTPAGAASLDLEGSADGQAWTVVAPGVTDTYTDGPFDPNTTRYYRVVAVTPTSRTPGPTAEATTAPPLSAPNSLSVVLGSVTTSGTTPKAPPAGPVTYTLPAVPNLGNSGTSGGLDWNTSGWQWLLAGGTSQTISPYTGGATSAPLTPPGAITFNNLTSYSYTLTLPTLPHDLVDENGRIYDFAAGWVLCSSTNGASWTTSPAFDWRSTLGPPSTRTGFGWTRQQDGAWLENPAPIAFDATPATTYYYQLVGQDTAGLLVYGSVTSITTPADGGGTATPPVSPNAPAAPGQVAFSNLSQTSLTLTMPTLPDRATSMTLQASTDGGNSWVVVASNLGENEVVPQTNLTSAKSYAYCVAAVNAYGATQGAPQAVVTLGGLPAVPDPVSVDNRTTSSYTFTLPQLPNAATSFTLQTSDNGLTWTNVGTGYGSGAVVTRTGLAPNTSAPYLLLAVNQYGYAPGAPFFATTGGLPSAPAAPTVANLGASGFDLRLPGLPTGAASLTLETSTDAGTTWAAQDGETGLAGSTVVSEAATPGATYAFRLVAVNQWGETPGSPLTVTAPQTPAAPGNVSLSNLLDTSFRLLMPPLPSGADTLKLETTTDAITWLAEAGHDALAGGAFVNESGLTPNTTYRYRVVAVNQWGETPGSGFLVTTAGPPQAPGATVVDTATPTSFALHLPGLPVGASFLSLQTSPDNSEWTTVENNLDGLATVPLTGLAPLTTYTYRLTADNGYGSTPGLPFTAETAGLPSAPGEVAVSGQTSSSLILTLPGLPSGATSLTLQVLSGADWITDGPNANVAGHAVISESGLAAGTTYQYQLLANNAWGSTPGLSFAAATSVNAPAAPDIALVSKETLTDFTLVMPALPANADSLTLQTSTDSGHTWAALNTGLAGGASVDGLGWPTGSAAMFRVVAVNGFHQTAGSQFSVPKPSLPGAPGQVSVAGPAGTACVLTMPSLPSYATSLTLQTSTDGGATWVTDGTNTGLGSGGTVSKSGLALSTTYYYRALAVNEFGSTAGLPFLLTTPSLPSAPADVSASSSSPTTIFLSMPDLPANATGLTLQTSPDGGSTWTDDQIDVGARASWPENGKTPNTTYYYRVVAFNAFGSTAGNTVSVNTKALPTAPSVATVSNLTPTACTLTMPALPANTDSLTLQNSPNGGTTWNPVTSGLAGGATAPQSGLTPNSTYTFRVVAFNAYGSTAGSSFTVTTPVLPGTPATATPSGVTATACTLNMPSLPANATSLTLQTSTDAGTTWADANTGLAGNQPVSKTGLTAGTTYYYRVVAVNTYGSTAGSSFTVVTASLPSAPGIATSSPTTATAFNLFMPSLPANATTLTLQNSPDAGTTWNSVNTGLAGGATVPKTGLTTGTTYYYRVLAVNAYGSTVGASFTVVAGAPGMPYVVTYSVVNATSFNLKLNALTPTNATSQTLQVLSGTNWITDGTHTGLAPNATVNETGMTAGASYTYRMLAVNAYGSTPGNPVTVTAGAPSMPGNVATSNVTSTSFTATAPSLPAAATSLTLKVMKGGTTVSTTTGLAGGAVVPISGLTTGTTYSVYVIAVDTYGSTNGGSVNVTTL